MVLAAAAVVAGVAEVLAAVAVEDHVVEMDDPVEAVVAVVVGKLVAEKAEETEEIGEEKVKIGYFEVDVDDGGEADEEFDQHELPGLACLAYWLKTKIKPQEKSTRERDTVIQCASKTK